MSRKYLVLSAIGRDRPGLVDRITKIVVDYSANVEESRMARLGGEFAALFLISVLQEKSDSLCRSLEELSRESLIIVTKLTSHSAGGLEEYIPYSLSVAGADHEGIIHEITRFLAEKGINIAKMETSVQNSPNSGTPIFSMLATIQVPPGLLPEDLNHRLSLLGDRLAVDITLRMVEPSS